MIFIRKCTFLLVIRQSLCYDSYKSNAPQVQEGNCLMINIPKMKVGIVAVSRDCFPESLSVNRRKALVDAYTQKYNAEDIYECPVCIVESEIHMVQALDDLKKAGCNALCVYLGNFGPEIAETLLAKHFDGPKMFCAAAEENTGVLSSSRGDAYCGMLNASYNLKLRGVTKLLFKKNGNDMATYKKSEITIVLHQIQFISV